MADVLEWLALAAGIAGTAVTSISGYLLSRRKGKRHRRERGLHRMVLAIGDVVFQVRLVGNRAKLQAKLFDRKGRGFTFRESDPREGEPGGVIDFASLEQRDRYVIEPLFRYPSDLHLGELMR